MILDRFGRRNGNEDSSKRFQGKGKGKQRRDGQTERLEDTDTDSSNAQKREDVDFEEEFFMQSTDVPSYWFLVD